MTSAGPIPIIAALGIQPTYSARQAAVLLGKSYSWLDQRLRKGQFVLPDGTMVQPLRTAGGYRRFTLAMLEDIALSSYRSHWFSMDHLKSTYRELLIAAHRETGDVDFLRRRIDLHRNAVQVGSKVVVGTLKSNKNRTVVLPGFVIDALAGIAKGKGRDDLLWPTASGGYMGPPASKESWLSGAFERCRKSDPTFPRVTAHALRHTAASLAFSAGANPKVVQRMLGHASAAMTLDVYADLFDSDLTSVTESVGKMWARNAEAHMRSKRNVRLPAQTLEDSPSLLSGLN